MISGSVIAPQWSDEDRAWLGYTIVGAIVSAVATKLAEVAYDEFKRERDRREQARAAPPDNACVACHGTGRGPYCWRCRATGKEPPGAPPVPVDP